MAWTTPKTFTAGERLFAQDLNTYVSDNLADLDPRTVKTFADASARTSGITSPTEGMLSYLADTDAVEVYDGSAWTAVGSDPNPGIGTNVVQAVKTDTFSTSVTGWNDVTGLSVTITPTSSASKVLLMTLVNVAYEGVSQYTVGVQFSGGNAGDFRGDAAGSRARTATYLTEYGGAAANADDNTYPHTAVYLDSPATTSATTYKVQVYRRAGTVYVNRSSADLDALSHARVASSLVAIEVAA